MLLSTLVVVAVLAQTPSSASATRAAETLALGSTLDAAVHGQMAYVALEKGGIAVIDLSTSPPRLVRRMEEGRRFVRLVLTGEALLAVEQREEAHAFSLQVPAAPQPTSLARALSGTQVLPVASAPEAPAAPAPALPSPERPGAKSLTVTAVQGAEVVLSGGRNVGLVPGTHVRLAAAEGPPSEEPLVLEVVEVNALDAVARLGRGERARVGDAAEPTDAPVTARLVAPRTTHVRLRAGFHARPFLALEARTATGHNARAGGLLADLFVAYRPERWPVVLHARLEPVGVGLGTGDRHTPGAAWVAATWSGDMLEAGLGVGSVFGQKTCLPEYDETIGDLREVCEDKSSLGVQQMLRLGAQDGFHFSWSSSILAREDRFVFGSGRGELQLPISARTALFAAGGGAFGHGFGELGVRTFLEGTGGPGSLLLTGSLGAVSLSDGVGNLYGPSVAIGLEWRR